MGGGQKIDTFIVNIYSAVRYRGTTDFRRTTLRSLGVLIPFDGALWGSGNLDDKTFHTVATLGVDKDYPRALESTSEINPILPALLSNMGKAINLRSIVPDDQLYSSEIYRQCFSKYGVERVLSAIYLDERSKIYTLISLYRFDREQDFSEEERDIFESASYHMVNAAQTAFFMHMAQQSGVNPDVAAAICDSHGLFYEAQPEFLDLLEKRYEGWKGERLPFEIPEAGQQLNVNGLCVTAEPYDDLFCLRVWEERPTDNLSDIDRQIVDLVSKGMTMKEVGRELGLASSTVSNRLHRIYRQFGVTNRAGLAKFVHGL